MVKKTQHIFMVRGLPGSGKSTYAKKIVEAGWAGIHLDADMYWMHEGEYKFNADKLSWAHGWLRGTFKHCLDAGLSIALSGTLLKPRYIRPYTDMIKAQLLYNGNIKLHIRTMLSNYGSIHNVPESVLESMRNNFVPNIRLNNVDEISIDYKIIKEGELV